MSSRKRNWIQDTTMFRGVFLRDGQHVMYSGPYDTYAKAKASVTHWIKAGGLGEYLRRNGHVDMATPEWQKVGD
jgi:hypothetical protein